MNRILAVPVVVAVVLTLFAWPTARLEPRDLPVGVAGPAAATAPLEQGLRARDGAFDVRRYTDEAAARQAIEDREVYGAFVATPGGPKVLTSTASSSAVAQLLQHAATDTRGPAQHVSVEVEDVVSAGPRGPALPSSVLPLVLAGILTGAVAALVTPRGGGARMGLVVLGSVLAGLAATAIVQSWLDVVGGDWLANAGALSLTVLAIASMVAGLHALMGTHGISLAALLMVLVGNPFSGVGTAPELLPEPVGGIGQLMPPGAGGNLLRSTGYFDGAAAGGHAAVLGAWALAGLVMVLAAKLRVRRVTWTHSPAGTESSAI